MRTTQRILTFFMLLAFYSGYCQPSDTAFTNNISNTTTDYSNDIPGGNTFNTVMLNVFFAKEVASYFNGSSDLTLNTFYASLDSDESSFSLGMTYDLRGTNKLAKLNYILNGSIKVKAEDEYVTLYEDGSFAGNDLGLTLKITKVHDGTINFSGTQNGAARSTIISNNRTHLLAKYGAKIAAYKTEGYPEAIDSINDLQNLTTPATKLATPVATYDELTTAKHDEFYKKIAEEEITFIKENKLYHFMSDKYTSVEFFIPIDKKYKILDTTTTFAMRHKNFIPFKATANFTYFRKYTSGFSFVVNPELTWRNNNNIISDEEESLDMNTIKLNPATNQELIKDSDKVYIKNDYKQFLTTTVKCSGTILFWDTVGLSSSLEKNFGEYDPWNWKFGIPVSLKDNEGNSSVNFELHWKEVNANHIIGISLNVAFGAKIN